MAGEIVQQSPDVPVVSGQNGLVQVGNTQMTPEMFSNRANEIRSDYASALEDVNEKFFNLSKSITEIQSGISQQIQNNQGIATSSYNNLVTTLNQQITNVANAQNMQVSNAASQLDAMMATGQFGGNVYRSQQVYAMNLTNIIGSAMKTVADVTLQYRSAAEQMRVQASQQNLASYIQGASVVISSMTELAKTYGMVRSDLTSSKNNQLNQVFDLRVRQDIANRDRAAQLRISQQEQKTRKDVAKMQVEAEKLMTQWRLDASMQETVLNIQLQDRRIEADKMIAKHNNDIRLRMQEIDIAYQKSQAQLQREMQKQLEIRRQDKEYNLGIIRIDAARQENEARMAHELKIEQARLNAQYESDKQRLLLANKQFDLEVQQFNYNMALTQQKYQDEVNQRAQEAVMAREFMASMDEEGAQFQLQLSNMMSGVQQELASM